MLEEIATVLGQPERILLEAARLTQPQAAPAELAATRRQLDEVVARQGRLARLYVAGELPEDVLRPQSEQLSRRREALESRLLLLERDTHAPALDLDRLRDELPQVTARLRRWIMEPSEEDVNLMLEALQVEVSASRERVQIDGAIPLVGPAEGDPSAGDLVTIAQTSA